MKMRCFETFGFKTQSGQKSGYVLFKADMKAFIKHFRENLEASAEFSKPIELRSKTLKGNLSEIPRKAYIRANTNTETEEHEDYALVFYELKCYHYDLNTYSSVQNAESKFMVFRVRDATQEELDAKKSRDDAQKSFDTSNLKMTYRTYINAYTDRTLSSSTSLDNKQEYKTFSTFEEAKAHLEKMRKLWHMELTLKGLSGNIVHSAPNELTVYKPGCTRKFIHTFQFSIQGKMRYEYPTVSTP